MYLEDEDEEADRCGVGGVPNRITGVVQGNRVPTGIRCDHGTGEQNTVALGPE